jgi:hypothetical protein
MKDSPGLSRKRDYPGNVIVASLFTLKGLRRVSWLFRTPNYLANLPLANRLVGDRDHLAG